MCLPIWEDHRCFSFFFFYICLLVCFLFSFFIPCAFYGFSQFLCHPLNERFELPKEIARLAHFQVGCIRIFDLWPLCQSFPDMPLYVKA